jgi:hypothetical protein
MTAYFASNQDPFSKLIKPASPIKGTFNVSEPSLHSQNDEHLLAQKPVTRKKEAVRCAMGLALYALGLFLFAYGQLVQPSLLLMLAGSAVLVFSCYTFIPEIKSKAADDYDDDAADDEDISRS